MSLQLGLVFCVLSLVGWGRAADWPHWRGLNRDGLVSESSGWNATGVWPPPQPVWQMKVGAGASAPLVVAGKLYAIGWEDGRDMVRWLESATGKIIWEQSYAAPEYGRHSTGDKGMYRGATATPEFDPKSSLLFTLGCDGTLNAWDTKAG